MASGSPGNLQRDLNTLFESGSLTGLTDRDLVERVTDPPDDGAEAAFEALVSRHGPMVLRVCRNVLGHRGDAEDAFQATFLVLVKQRGSIRNRDSVASWLYGVAARVAARARVDAARRRKTEQGGIRLAADSAAEDNAAEALDQAVHGPIVQEEVRRLPEKYRAVVLLCYWEGLTQEQAALQLGCPIGTVRSRIARARDLLRRRLVRRGLPATAGAVAVFAAPTTPAAIALAPVSQNLIGSSVQAAMSIAAGKSTAGVVPATVSSLMKRILWSLAMMKMTKLAVVSTVAILLALGAQSWAQRPHRQDRQPDRLVAKEKSRAATTERDQLVDEIEPPDLLLVEVLEGLPGRPISGERLVRPDGKISLGFYGDVYVAGMTPPEVKEKIVLHLRKYLSDEVLGLVENDPETGAPRTDKAGKVATIDPKDTDRVFVSVAAYNSRFYYVQGEVATPGRLPFTGSEHILDVIHLAGGVLPSADRTKMKLIRNFPKGSPVQVLPIDYEEITMGTDSSTNYAIMPSDRIVIPHSAGESATSGSSRPASSGSMRSEISENPQLKNYFERNAQVSRTGGLASRDIEHRLNAMEKKLDAILEKVGEPKNR